MNRSPLHWLTSGISQWDPDICHKIFWNTSQGSRLYSLVTEVDQPGTCGDIWNPHSVSSIVHKWWTASLLLVWWYYSTWSFQHACQCFQSNFDVPRTPNLLKLPQTPYERTILPKLTMTRYGRNLNLKKIQLENQGWISHMGSDGPTFVPKSGYFLLICVKVCPQKLAFSWFFSQFYELASLTKCWLFQTRNPPLSLFLTFFRCCIFIILFKYYLKSRF